MPVLSDLRPGQAGRIDAVAAGDAVGQRLLEMGLLEGETVEVIRYAPLGDPVEVRLNDYCLSLRRSEAARVTVTPLGGA
jgi:ferrous iron transport protein A